MNIWEEVKAKTKFYHSHPNNARPPRQGLWLNKSTNDLEIWSFYREPDKKDPNKVITGYGRMGYTSLNNPDNVIENWIRAVMAKFIGLYGEDQVPYWLLNGGRDPEKIKEGDISIARAGGLHIVKH